MDETKIIVVIRGGVCQGVFSNNGKIDCTLIDWDDAEQDEEYREFCQQTADQLDQDIANGSFKNIL